MAILWLYYGYEYGYDISKSFMGNVWLTYG